MEYQASLVITTALFCLFAYFFGYLYFNTM